MSEPLEAGRVTLVKWLNPDGGMTIEPFYSDGLTLLDVLGMLAFGSFAAPLDFKSEE